MESPLLSRVREQVSRNPVFRLRFDPASLRTDVDYRPRTSQVNKTERTARVVVASIVASFVFGGYTTAMGSDRFEKYDAGGAWVISRLAPATQAAKATADIRDFIWTHWREQRLGHLVVTWIDIEGEPSTFSFLIEPDKQGTWCVAVQVARTRVSRAGAGPPIFESSGYTSCKVERSADAAMANLSRSVRSKEPDHGDSLLLFDSDGMLRQRI